MNNCCENCFKDHFLIEFIQSKGNVGNCDFCGSADKKCIQIESSGLGELFSPFFDLYTPVENFMPVHELKEYEGELIWEIIQSDWDIFNDSIDSRELLIEIAATLGYDTANDLLFSTFVLNESEYFKEDKDQITVWQLFAEELKERNRFFPSRTIDFDTLDTLLQALSKKIEMQEDIYFFRARNSHGKKKHPPKQMGMPPPEKTLNGRANPVGIPYLYLASDKYTAIAETRPFKNDHVTVGRFNLKEDLSLVDLRDVSPFQFSKDESFEDFINQIGYLKTLGSDLSKPVNPRDAALEYLPTQYLCEHIKERGWDGVIYKSSLGTLGTGYNIAIFEEKLICDNTELFKITYTSIPQYKYIKV